MTDTELFTLIRLTLIENLSVWPFDASLGPITVQQKQQPVKQGIPTAATVYLEKLFHNPHGSSRVYYDVSPEPNMIEENEGQVYTATFQVSAFVIQKPENPALPTASELADAARVGLQRHTTIRKFAAEGVGLLRVSMVGNPYFSDDRDRQEATPSFDLVVTYVRTAPPATIDRIIRVDSLIVQVP
ncbi:hypothetical protein D3C81_678180 [compost metagenome]